MCLHVQCDWNTLHLGVPGTICAIGRMMDESCASCYGSSDLMLANLFHEYNLHGQTTTADVFYFVVCWYDFSGRFGGCLFYLTFLIHLELRNAILLVSSLNPYLLVWTNFQFLVLCVNFFVVSCLSVSMCGGMCLLLYVWVAAVSARPRVNGCPL